MCRRRFGIVRACVLLTSTICHAGTARADSVSLVPVKDNTLYQDPGGALSNGQGEFMFAGQNSPGQVRRAVVAFDVAASIPAGSIINSVTLTLNMSRTNPGTQSVALHRLLADWGEGASNAGSPGGGGAPAAPGDATWLHRSFPADFWTTPGGDFSPAASATQMVGGIAPYTWGSTPGMVADVQTWLDSPAANFGWAILGNETATASAKRFDSRENAVAANRPVLFVDYAPIPEPATLFAACPVLLGLFRRPRR